MFFRPVVHIYRVLGRKKLTVWGCNPIASQWGVSTEIFSNTSVIWCNLLHSEAFQWLDTGHTKITGKSVLYYTYFKSKTCKSSFPGHLKEIEDYSTLLLSNSEAVVTVGSMHLIILTIFGYPSIKGNIRTISPGRIRFDFQILAYLVTIQLLYDTGCLSY